VINIPKPRSTFFKVFSGGRVRPHPNVLVLVKSDKKGFNELRFYSGQFIKDWPEGITFYMKGTHYEDYLVVGLHWMVVSDGVRKVFEECELTGVQLLPVHIVIDGSGKEIGPYWAMNVYQEVDALHWEYTQWLEKGRDHFQDENPMLGVWEIGLRYEPIHNLDIFRLNVKGEGDPKVYISDRVKKALEKAKVTDGFNFACTPAY
jgi:hypothetical protein